jgi:hypothetical protein
MEFLKGADIKPPRDYPISLGAYFFDVQNTLALIRILTKIRVKERRKQCSII